MLSIASHNKFMGFADGNILNWCPTLNLLTVSMNKMSIWVYRLNGERIYSINNKSPITSIAFINNGKYFCLLGIDGLIKIYDSNSGKLLKILNKTFDQIKLLKWNVHSPKSQGKFDHLFKVDVLSNLPKISDGTVEIEELNNTVSLNFLTIVDSQSLSLNFNNLLTIHDIQFNKDNIKIIDHLDNNDLSDQFFLIQDEERFELIHMTLGLDDKVLVDIILKVCKVMAIINYLSENIKSLQQEIKPFYQLFDKYLENLRDSIEESKSEDPKLATNSNIPSPPNSASEDLTHSCLSQHFYDILLTNLIPSYSKDYWLNQFGERGYKKLSKLGNSVYNFSREIIYTKFISSIERLIIVLNDLKGLNSWFIDSEESEYGLNLQVLEDLLDHSKSMLKTFFQLIWDINQEQKLFNNFMDWIKFEIIDKLVKEDDIQSYLNQPQMSFNYPDLVKYINDYIFSNIFGKYFEFDVSWEILIQSNCQKNVVEAFQSLANTFNDNLFHSFENFIKQSVQFNKQNISLDLSSSTNIKLKNLDQNYGIVSSIGKENDSSILSLVKFSTHSSESLTKCINFNSDTLLITYEFNDKELILVLKVAGIFKVEVINFIDLFEYDGVNVNYDDILKIGELQGINLENPKLLAINKNAANSWGCLLDENRQNYVVFSINKKNH